MGRTTDVDGVLLHASHSHLFRGARLRAPGAEPATASQPAPGGQRTRQPTGPGHVTPSATTTDVRVIFSDFSDAEAILTASEDAPAWTLSVGAYRTAAGTEIPARAWELELLPSGDVPEFKVVARRPDPVR